MSRNMMRIETHETKESIPVGKAILVMDNNGFVGTNNGWPLVGQPALFPEAQARAILTAWNSFEWEQLPCPENMEGMPWFGKVFRWLNCRGGLNHD